jgi:type II secretory pathway pseudopilin PulG
MRHLLSSRRRRGLTLPEIAIASTIMSVLIIGVITLFVSIIQQERTNLRMLQMSYQSQQFHRELRRVASYGSAITSSTSSVRFDDLANGTTAELRYEDTDNNPATIGDNTIIFDPDVATDNDERLVLRYVSPLVVGGTTQPIFRRQAGTPAPLIVEFRIGDRTGPTSRADRRNNSAAKADDAFTGPGLQTMVYRGAFTPRVRI